MSQPQNQVQNQQVSLTTTAVAIDPVAVVYNVFSSDIERFVEKYLEKKSIAGVVGVRSRVVRDGNQRPEVELFAFFEMNSPEILTGMKDIAPHLRDMVETGGFRGTDTLNRALRPIVSNDVKFIPKSSQRVVYVKLNEFRVLGMMLAADPRFHNIAITDVRSIKKKQSMWTVFKSNRFVDREDTGGDRLLNILENDRD